MADGCHRCGHSRRFQRRADRHRPDERVLPRCPDLRRRRHRSGIGRAQGRRQRSDEQADRVGARAVRARGAVLHRGRVPHRRARRALLSRADRHRNGRVPPAARGRGPGGRRRRDPRCHNRTGDAGDDRAGPAACATARRRRAGRRGVAQPRSADEPGAHHAVVCGVRRALRRPHRSRAARGVRKVGGQFRRIPRSGVGSGPCSRAGARRLPVGQHAFRGAWCRPAAHRGRLADRHVGARDDRCRLLPRLRAAR